MTVVLLNAVYLLYASKVVIPAAVARKLDSCINKAMLSIFGIGDTLKQFN